MKKIILAIGAVSLLVACNSSNDVADIEENTEDVSVKNDEQHLAFTSYSLLTDYTKNPEEFIKSLKGKKISISDVIIKFGQTDIIDGQKVMWGEGPGYIETLSDNVQSNFLDYSAPDDGVTIVVDGKEMAANSKLPNILNLVKLNLDDNMEIIELETTKDGDQSIYTYHTQITIDVNGDDLEASGAGIKINGGSVTSIKNF
ncbi:MAG: hypothetical protein ACI837_002844 [Crocinitomicaceae bacterium]|jgi:hypothetical protein